MVGTVSLATQGNAPVGNRNLVETEGSVTGMPGSAAYGGWKTLSTGAAPPNYNGRVFPIYRARRLAIVLDIDQGKPIGSAQPSLTHAQIKQFPTQQVGGSRSLGRDRRRCQYPITMFRVTCDYTFYQREQ